MEQAAAAEDETGFLRLDRALNLLVLEAAKNEFAAATMALMHGLSRRFWFLHWRQRRGWAVGGGACGVGAGNRRGRRRRQAAAASDALVDYIEASPGATLARAVAARLPGPA